MFFSLSCKNSIRNGGLTKQSKRLMGSIMLLKKIRNNSIIDKSHHKIIYDFPGIKLTTAVLRTKVWFPPVGIALSPALYFLDGSLVLPLGCATAACLYGLTGVVLSKLAENMVGKIYVNKEGDLKDVIISSTNGRGQRVDRIYHVDELINYDFPSKLQRRLGFINIGIENSPIVYKVNVHSCKLIDPGICNYVFGNFWDNNNINKETNDKSKTRAKISHKSQKISST